MSCAGKVALVTGASRGIGRAIALRLAAEGARVAVTARSLDSHPEGIAGTLEETVDEITRHGGQALAIGADLLEAEARRRIVERTCEALGPIDILVNNAAAAIYMPLADYSEKRMRITFEVNLIAPFHLSQLVFPFMREKGQGWIVNVSSATAEHPPGPPYGSWEARAGAGLYATTKAALNRLTGAMAAEFADSGIAVNTLAPVAAVLTEGAEALDVMPEGTHLEPVETVAEAALVLCTCDPRQLTGRVTYSEKLLAST